MSSSSSSSSPDEMIASLRQQNAILQSQIESLTSSQTKHHRVKIIEMSDEVIDTNPYSRLMALQKMGIVSNYQEIRNTSFLIIGIGGIGSIAAEMLTRCGCGKLILVDYDTVELANMNRLLFRPEHVGLEKTKACMRILKEINPDVEFEEFTGDITTTTNFERLMKLIETGGVDGKQVSLVLSCVDNYTARSSINLACTSQNQVWMESGVSEDALRGHIQLLLPGRTSCFDCLPPLIVASGIDEKTLKRDGVCAASLPTTMGMIAGMLVQNCLKYLLGFGQVSYYQGYCAMTNHFPSHILYPNPECSNAACRKMQSQYKDKWQPMKWKSNHDSSSSSQTPIHEDNEWNITVDDENVSSSSSDSKKQPTSDLKFQYDIPPKKNDVVSSKDDDFVRVDPTSSLEDLMKQLHST